MTDLKRGDPVRLKRTPHTQSGIPEWAFSYTWRFRGTFDPYSGLALYVDDGETHVTLDNGFAPEGSQRYTVGTVASAISLWEGEWSFDDKPAASHDTDGAGVTHE